MEKQEIVERYIKLKDFLQKAPSSREFYKKSGVSRKQLGLTFGRNPYSQLQELAGDKPNQFGKERSNLDDILTTWGELTRKLGQLPIQNDWTFNDLKPTISGIAQVHGLNFSELPYSFLEITIGVKPNLGTCPGSHLNY